MEVLGYRNFRDSYSCTALFQDHHLPSLETYDFLIELTSMSSNIKGPYFDHTELMAPRENGTNYVMDFPLNITFLTLDPILNAIFRDTLIDTNNPALAWQALMTSVMRMAYDDWLPTFDSFSDAKITSTIPC